MALTRPVLTPRHYESQRTLEAYYRRLAAPTFMDGTPIGSVLTTMNLRAILPTPFSHEEVDAFRAEVDALVQRRWDVRFEKDRVFHRVWAVLLEENLPDESRRAGVKYRHAGHRA